MRNINLQLNGNQIVATWDNFIDLASSPAGFGETIIAAITNLIVNSSSIQINNVITSLEDENFIHTLSKREEL